MVSSRSTSAASIGWSPSTSCRERRPSARVAWPRGRAAAVRARVHDRSLPAVVRVRDARWVRGGPLERSGVGRVRPLRRAGRRARGRDAGRDVESRAGAEVGGRPGPAPADPRLGGVFGVITQLAVRVRPVPARRVYEGWQARDFDSGLGASADARAGRTRADRHAAVGRGRDGARARPPRRARHGERRRLPGDRRLRGNRGGGRAQARGRRAGPGRRRVRRRSPVRARAGPATATAVRTCATRCWMPGCWSRRSRP